MTEIDVIMGMLDWNNSAEEQAAGLAQAAQAENFQVFLQPCTEHYNKNVWDNCAKTLAMRSDAELDACLENLLAWLRDMNWPGAFLILERLQAFQNSAALHRAIAGSLLCAQALGDGPISHTEFQVLLHVFSGREMRKLRNILCSVAPVGRDRNDHLFSGCLDQ